jgi:4-aminobutyrate aminotransferase
MDKRACIRVSPPGPKGKQIVDRDTRFLATSTKTAPIVAKSARGVLVEDVDGNTFLDFTSGVGVVNTGHCHPAVVAAVQKQAAELMHFAGTDFYYDVQVKLAEKLTKITPGKFDKKVFYTNSGAESVEAAIKLSRWSSGRKQFVAFIGAFHGRTMGALSLTASKPVHKDRFFPTMPGVEHIPFAYCYRCPYKMEYPGCGIWCARILEELYFTSFLPPDEVAAVFMEPVQGEGGYVVPPPEWVRAMRDITSRHGILLVDDEVQAGFGRTGKWFAIEHYGVTPDIVCMAKGMGSGLPIGAIVYDAKLDYPMKGVHSNTYGGNLLGCASTLAGIDVIEKERLAQNAARMGNYLHKRLLELQEKHECIGDVRGKGLMQATEFVQDRRTKQFATKLRDDIEEVAYKNGLMLLGCGKSSIRYIPPLVVNKDQIDQAIEILDKSVMEAGKR